MKVFLCLLKSCLNSKPYYKIKTKYFKPITRSFYETKFKQSDKIGENKIEALVVNIEVSIH